MSSMYFSTLTLMSVFLSGVSADQGVSLICNTTVNVTSGENLILTCDIKWDIGCENRKPSTGASIQWKDTVGDLCINNTCNSETQTNATLQMCKVTEDATLQMCNVTEDKKITVKINANCGMDDETIAVNVNRAKNDKTSTQNPEERTDTPGPYVFAGIFVGAAVVGVGMYIIVKKKKSHHVLPQEDQKA